MADIRKRIGAKGPSYQVRVIDPTNKSGYSYKSFATAAEARAYREGPKAPAAKKHGLDVAEAVDIWLQVCKDEGRDGRAPVSPATYRYYTYTADIMKSYAWTKGIRELRKPEVIEFRSWLLANHSRYLANKILTYFHGVLAEMSSRGKIDTNVAAEVRVQQETRYSEEVTIPTEDEIAALLAAADQLASSKNPQIAKQWRRSRPMLYLAVDSGMRPQEYVAVAGKDLSALGIRVERAINKSGELSVPKTKAARRFIELSPQTIELVSEYRDCFAPKNDFDLIFPTEVGTWQSPANWGRRGFSVACREAGLVTRKFVEGREVILPKFTPYDIRHYFASMLIAEGVDLAKIKTLMGHADISTTFDTYAHLIRRKEEKISSRAGLVSIIKKCSLPASDL